MDWPLKDNKSFNKKPNDEDGAAEEKTSMVRSGTFTEQFQQASKTPPALVMLVGPPGSVGKVWPIDQENVIIGRSMTSAIFVDDKSVSRSHSKLSNHLGDVTLIDLESSNKTIINGQSIPPFIPFKLKNNDQVKVGNVLFKFLEQGSIEAAASQAMQQKSERDTLTQAWNKGALLAKGPEALQRAKLLNASMSVLVLDIDHFKKINDTYGHAAGDYVLKALAEIISKTSIRSDDYFARFGGEEFVIIMFGSNIRQAQEIGERIRASIQIYPFEFQGTTIPVTISVGVSSFVNPNSSWEQIFERADHALYQSKKSGRNRVTVATE